MIAVYHVSLLGKIRAKHGPSMKLQPCLATDGPGMLLKTCRANKFNWKSFSFFSPNIIMEHLPLIKQKAERSEHWTVRNINTWGSRARSKWAVIQLSSPPA